MALQEKIAAERADLFAFLRMLSADEGTTRSLCEGWRIASTSTTSAVQHRSELIEGERPSVVETVEFLWGQQGMLDGHERLLVAHRLERDVDDAGHRRVRPVRIAPREAQ